MKDFWIPKPDCRYYRGERPCRYNRICHDCTLYSPWKERILIIKLGAMGDVLRTTPILYGLKSKYPDAQLTWLTHSISKPLLENNSIIDRLWTLDETLNPEIIWARFDAIYCFDKSPEAISIARHMNTSKRYGFTADEDGNLIIANDASHRAWILGLDDNLKFHHNKLTYPELIFEMAEIDYNKEEYILDFTQEEIDAARERWLEISSRISHKSSLDKRLIGINIGSGRVYANKSMPLETLRELVSGLHKKGYPLLLLGGPMEVHLQAQLQECIDFPLVFNNFHGSVRQFAAILSYCSLIITGDTLAMHLAIARKIPVISIFTSTCHEEIEIYGRGTKIITKADCAPCYLRICPKGDVCLDSIDAMSIIEKVVAILNE